MKLYSTSSKFIT